MQHFDSSHALTIGVFSKIYFSKAALSQQAHKTIAPKLLTYAIFSFGHAHTPN